MPWVKIDDAFFTDDAVMAAGPDGRLLFIAGLCHASRNLTDGAIDKRALQGIAGLAGADPTAAELLVELGLWVDEGSSYRAPRYLDFNPPAEKVRAEREQAKARMHARRSGEVQANTGRSSPTPVPSPSRPETSSSSSSTVTGTELPSDLWKRIAEKQASMTTATIGNLRAWTRKAAENAQADLTDRARWLVENYDLTTSQLVDVLIQPTAPQWLAHHARRTSA